MGQPGAPPEWPPSAGRGIPAEPGGPYDPASWSEGPYGLLPRPPRRSNNAVLAAAVVGALVVALLIAGVVALGGGGSTDAAKLAAEAARGLADAPGLSYQGTFGDKPASFGVTAAGSARGTYTSHDSLVAMVSVDGAVYLRANQGFWTGRGDSASDAERAAGRWTKAPDSALDIDASRLLAPGRVAQALRQATAEPNPQRSSIHGTSTVKVSSGELTYYVSTGKPYRLVRVEGIGDEDWSLDVTVLSRSTVGTVFSALRKDVAGLQDAYDPSVGVLPGRLAFGLCDATGCEIRVPARATGGGSGRAVRITMSAYISGQGEKKGDCSDTKTVRGTRSVTLACVVRGGWPAYYKWMRSTPGSHTYDGHAEFSATVNSARDVADLLAKLTRERQGS